MRRHTAAFALLVLLPLACGRKKVDPDYHVDAGTPVILISVDTLRADHLPAYGYKNVETPNIDALAADSIVFNNAYSQVPLTLPSHLTILTGQLPQENGVRNNIGYEFDATKHETIGSLLKRDGYSTGAAISAYVLRGASGIRNAFDYYEDSIEGQGGVALGQLQRPGTATESIAETWIQSQGDKPFFFMLHLFEPHSPYTPPEPFRTRYANGYDGEIAAADDVVGKFVSFLKNRGIYDRAVVIFLSDHGEGLMDHGEDEHGIFLYREAIHVPLIVKLPKARYGGTKSDAVVQLIDVFPTIANLVKTKPQHELRGQSLLASAAAAEAQPRRVYSETIYPRIHLGWSDLRSLVDDHYQFIQAPRPELYDMKSDPAEKSNILPNERRVYSAMRKEMDSFPTAIAAPTNINPEDAAKLAALGYIGSTSNTSAATGPLPDPKDHIGEINLMREGSRAEAQHDFDKAITDFKEVVRLNPRFADAWNKLGAVYEDVGRYDEALASYQEALKSSPELTSEYAITIGYLLRKMKRYDDAAAHAQLALKQNPAGAHNLLGWIAYDRHDFATAEREAQQAAEDPSFHMRASVLRARVLTDTGRPADALNLLSTLDNEVNEKHLEPVESLDLARASAFMALERPGDAEAALQREITHFPANLQAYANLAVLYMITGHPDASNAVLQRMTEQNPTHAAYLTAAVTVEAFGDKAAGMRWRTRANGE